MSVTAVEVSDLAKAYGTRRAVDGLDVAVAPGTVFALLGPNGAGKTTTIEICEGFRVPDAGTVRVLGLDPVRDAAALRPRVGVMLQDGVGGYTAARAEEMVQLFAGYARHPQDPVALLDRVGLSDVARTPVKRLSGGQKQRLSLAMALVGRPELVFLDEPTAGMDPHARRTTWRLISELREDGVTVVLTTHYLDEAEALADRVVVIDGGRVVADGSPAELTRRGAEKQVRFAARPGLPVAELTSRLGAGVTEAAPGRYVIDGLADPATLAAVTAWAAARDVLLTEIAVEHRRLEDVFLDVTSHDTATQDTGHETIGHDMTGHDLDRQDADEREVPA